VEEKAYPIREISRVTGVNSVTLRAWERRYGLIKPLRTEKGHRLYGAEDIELVRKIQQWLARGLPIGKVSELLESGATESTVVDEDVWQQLKQQVLNLFVDIAPNKIDHFFGQVLADYPAPIVADYLIAPVLATLDQDLFGNTVKKNLLESRLVEVLFALSYRQRSQGGQASVAIVQLAGGADRLRNVLLHYSLLMQQIKSEQLGTAAPDELILMAEQLQLDALIIFNDSTDSLAEFNRQLIVLAEKLSVPIIVGGFLGQPLLRGLPSNVYIAPEPGLQVLLQELDRCLSGTDTGGHI
jgi:MerR family transcriptional regulator, light-induced transcriptional regulator